MATGRQSAAAGQCLRSTAWPAGGTRPPGWHRTTPDRALFPALPAVAVPRGVQRLRTWLAGGEQDVRVVADADDDPRDAPGVGGIAGVHGQEVARVAAPLLELVSRDGLAEGGAGEALDHELRIALGLIGPGLRVAREQLAR